MDKTKVNLNKIRVFEAFAGIGSQRKALDLEKINYELVGMAEWYIPAIVSYQAIHNGLKIDDIDKKISRVEMVKYLEKLPLSSNSKEAVKKGYWNRKNKNDLRLIYTAVKKSKNEKNIFDITKLYNRTLKNIDLLTYSFPCQDLSQQGSQRGMGKYSGTRSGLLWEIEKALDHTPKKSLPKFLLMENVLSLSFKNNKKDFDMWLKKLEDLGYKNDIKILNSADFGSSQARRRVFVLSSLEKKIFLPDGNKNPKPLNSILMKSRDKDFLPALYEFDFNFKNIKATKSNIRKVELKDYTSFNSEAYIYDPEYTGPTLTASGANSRIKIALKDKKSYKSIRRLNEMEAFLYMGFEEKDYKSVNNLNLLHPNTMIYTCGNSISVEVLRKIMKKIEGGMNV